jgi:hypothetical protein
MVISKLLLLEKIMGMCKITEIEISATKFTCDASGVYCGKINNAIILGDLSYEVAYISRSSDKYFAPLREGTHPVFNALTSLSINDITSLSNEDEIKLIENIAQYCPYITDIESIKLLYNELLKNDINAEIHFVNALKESKEK